MESDDNYLMTSPAMSSKLDTNTSPPQAPPAPASTPTTNPLTLSIPTSVLLPNMPTIPLYHLQQSTSDTLKSINPEVSSRVDWFESSLRPLSRYSLTNRRECKSTSDEATVFEVNESSDTLSELKSHHSISPIRYSSSNSHSNRHNHSHGHHNVRLYDFVKQKPNTSANWSLSNAKAFYGQFGVNPALFNLARFSKPTPTTSTATVKSPTDLNNEIFSFNSNLSFSATTTTATSSRASSTMNAAHKMNKDRKFVKRLTSSNKFGIENLNKKHGDFNHNKKLFHAVIAEDEKTVNELLESNLYDVNCNDEKQRTCLHIASSRGNLSIVRLLLNYGANPNIKDCVNNLPIHLAIIGSHVPIVTLLLEAGTDINSLDLQGKTVLHLAGTRLRYLLNDDDHKVSPKLKYEAILIMNMIKEYLSRKKTNSCELDMLADKLESVFTIDDINNVTKELLDKFDSFNLK